MIVDFINICIFIRILSQGADYVHYIKENLQEYQMKLEEKEKELSDSQTLLQEKDLSLQENKALIVQLQSDLLLSRSFLEQGEIFVFTHSPIPYNIGCLFS